MRKPSEFARALMAAAQGKKTLKLQKRVGKLLNAGYKPTTNEDLFALKYYFNYETRGRRPAVFDPVPKLVREIRDYCRRAEVKVTQEEAFEHFKLFAQLQGYTPDEFEKFREQTLSDLRRPTRSKK
jgi:hypothetical protein